MCIRDSIRQYDTGNRNLAEIYNHDGDCYSCNVCVSVCAKILCERSYDRRSERVALVGGESLNNMNQKEVQL